MLMVFPGDRDRADEVSTMLDGVLEEGEGFLVRCQNYSVEVVPFHENEPFELKHTHEELYGCLLSINEDISRRRLPYFWIAMVSVVFFSVSLHLFWLDSLSSFDFSGIRSIWFYLAVTLAVAVIYNIVFAVIESGVYKRRRPELLQAIFEAGISRYRLLSRMEGDPSLSHVADQLKIDDASGKVPMG